MRVVYKSKSGYVYRHIRKDTNQVFYIGIGSDDNYYRSRSKSKRNPIWRRIVNKTQYDIEIIFDNLPFDKLIEKEKEFIALYGRICNQSGTLANLSEGGEGVKGYGLPNPGKGKKMADICKNPEQYQIWLDNMKKPFMLRITEPNLQEYSITCDTVDEFKELTNLNNRTLTTLKNKGIYYIPTIRNNSKHRFPTGTIIKFEYLTHEKKIFNPPIKSNLNKPFLIEVYPPNKDKYLVECYDVVEFYKKFKMNYRALGKLKKTGKLNISKRTNATRHEFVEGTILNFSYV